TGLSLTSSILSELADGHFDLLEIGSATFAGTISVDAPTTFNQPLALDEKLGGGGKIDLNYSLSGQGLAIHGSGDSTLFASGDYVQAYFVISDSIVLSGPGSVTLDSSAVNGPITLDGAINDQTAGATSLILTAGTGDVALKGAIGKIQALKSLAATGAVNVSSPEITT